MTAMNVAYDPKRAALTGYFVLLAEHDKDEEQARSIGDWAMVNAHHAAMLILTNAMEFEDKDPVPAGLGK